MNATTLTGLLPLLGGAGLLYLMVRNGGCGSHSRGGKDQHHGHGDEEAASRSGTPGASRVDPVCGMQVASVMPELQRSYMSRTFSFCSQECARKFDASPARYVSEQASHPRGHAHGC